MTAEIKPTLADAIERTLKLVAASMGTPNEDTLALIFLTRIVLSCRAKGLIDDHGAPIDTDHPMFFVVKCPMGHEYDWVYFGEQYEADEQNHEWFYEYPDDPRTVGVFPCFASNEHIKGTDRTTLEAEALNDL